MSEIRRTGSEDECGFDVDATRAVMPAEFRQPPVDKPCPPPCAYCAEDGEIGLGVHRCDTINGEIHLCEACFSKHVDVEPDYDAPSAGERMDRAYDAHRKGHR